MGNTVNDRAAKRSLLVLLVALLLCIAVLSALIVVNILNDRNSNQGDIGGTTQEENLDIATATIDEIIVYYQNKINSTSDDAGKIELYDIRLKTIIEKDKDREYVDQVLSDIVSIDEIEKTAASALQVCGFAEYFGNKEMYDEYQIIYQERWATERGHDVTEGRG